MRTNMADRSKTAAAASAEEQAFPPLYKKPTVLVAEVHAKAGLAPFNNFDFAADVTALPVTMAEFGPAGAQYPIVFAPGPEATPVIVLGLRDGENLFAKAWKTATISPNGTPPSRIYVPAYVRRYPYVIVENTDQKTQVLAVDAASDRFLADVSGHPGAEAFFDAAGGPSTAASAAMNFCAEFNQQSVATTAFAKAVGEANLLKSSRATMQFADRSSFALDGFQIVDEAAFLALPDATVTDWHKKGWLSLVTLHLASQRNWLRFTDLHEQRAKTEPAKK
jgi:hypothetical protein